MPRQANADRRRGITVGGGMLADGKAAMYTVDAGYSLTLPETPDSGYGERVPLSPRHTHRTELDHLSDWEYNVL